MFKSAIPLILLCLACERPLSQTPSEQKVANVNSHETQNRRTKPMNLSKTEKSSEAKNAWSKYQVWLKSNFPEGFANLNPGITEQQLAELESTIKAKLPEDYLAWTRVHNGQKSQDTGLILSNEFLSSSRIIQEWQTMQKLLKDGHFTHRSESNPPNAIKNDWWNTSWIPIASDGSGNLVCLDLSPGEQGIVGQIIDFDHESADRVVLSDSFSSYIKEYIEEILDDKYSYSEDYGRLIHADDL